LLALGTLAIVKSDLTRFRMLCEADRRMTCEQLKAHPVGHVRVNRSNADMLQFFFGVDWNTIRDIDAPFVPHLKSITDTSYFPTDELDQVPEIPSGADTSNDAKKDLAFLGYT
jgi:protein-serine/threonine kinase